MTIYPAIDLRKGRCVRLTQGRREDETVYSEEPSLVARRWMDAGARYLHVVDLDGAFTGNPVNEESVMRIRTAVSTPIQLGGGIRSLNVMSRWFALGISRVIIGTAAVTEPDLAPKAVDRWGPERIVVGIDARNGEVAIRGWEGISSINALDLAFRMKDAGVERVVYTDISRDGMMSGPNIEATRRLARESGLQVIASGGVSSLDDLAALVGAEEDGVEGVIIGKALYEGALDLETAITRYQLNGASRMAY